MIAKKEKRKIKMTIRMNSEEHKKFKEACVKNGNMAFSVWARTTLLTLIKKDDLQ